MHDISMPFHFDRMTRHDPPVQPGLGWPPCARKLWPLHTDLISHCLQSKTTTCESHLRQALAPWPCQKAGLRVLVGYGRSPDSLPE